MKVQLMRPALLLCLVFTADAAETLPPRDQPASRTMTIEELDATVSAFKAGTWYLPGSMGFPPPDHTGATVESDLARYVLRDNNLGLFNLSYNAARSAVPAGSNIVPEGALAPLVRLMNIETCRMMVLTAYWQSRLASAYHADMIHKLIEQLPAADQSAVQTRLRTLAQGIDARRSNLDGEVNACDGGAVPSYRDLADTLKAFNALRIETLAILPKTPGSSDPVWVKRNSACSAPAPSGTRDAPRRLLASMNLADLYPPEAVAFQIEGLIKVYIRYDTGGCVQEAAIAQTSGADILDRAGIEYGMGLQFQPAIVNGQPVDEQVVLPINFSLKDFPTSRLPAQPQP
jgi:TonB family protein